MEQARWDCAGARRGRARGRWGRVGAVLALAGCLLTGCAGGKPVSQRDMDLALIRAAEIGDVVELKRLLRAGADINATDADGWTPYLAASSMGRFEAMRILKALGARTAVYEGPDALPPI